MKSTATVTLVVLVALALALFSLVAVGADYGALPGVAAVIAAVGIAVKRIHQR